MEEFPEPAEGHDEIQPLVGDISFTQEEDLADNPGVAGETLLVAESQERPKLLGRIGNFVRRAYEWREHKIIEPLDRYIGRVAIRQEQALQRAKERSAERRVRDDAKLLTLVVQLAEAKAPPAEAKRDRLMQQTAKLTTTIDRLRQRGGAIHSAGAWFLSGIKSFWAFRARSWTNEAAYHRDFLNRHQPEATDEAEVLV